MFTATRPEARSQTDLANRVSMFTDPGGQPEARDITDSVRVLCHLWPSMNFFYYTQPSWVLQLQLLETFMYHVPVFTVYLARKISSWKQKGYHFFMTKTTMTIPISSRTLVQMITSLRRVYTVCKDRYTINGSWFEVDEVSTNVKFLNCLTP